MGRLSAAAKLHLAKGYTRGGADEPYLVLELDLPSGMRRYGSKGVSSDARGGIEPRIEQWGTLHSGIDLFTYALSESELTPELDDKDEDPLLRRLFAREVAKYPNQIRRSAATIRLIFPDTDTETPVSDANSFVVFAGILDGADQIAPMRWRLRLRPDDGPLRSTGSETGGVPKVQLGLYFSGLDSSIADQHAPVIYGVHNSNGSNSKGFIPCLLVDTAASKYLVPQGHIKSVSAVYVADALAAASTYSVTFETVKGATFTFIDFTAPQVGTVTADVEGLTANADGTGALLTDPGTVIKHLLVNFGYGDWRSGAWLADGTAPIDAAAFTTVGTFLTTLGYEASFYFDGSAQTELLNVFNGWLDDHAAYAWWTNLGKLTVKVLDYRPPASIYPTDVIEGDVDELGGFATHFDAQGIQREVAVKYLRGAAGGRTYQTLKVADLSVTEDISGSLNLEWAKASLL